MERERLKALAESLISDGLKQAEILCSEAWKDRRMAESMPKEDRLALKIEVMKKFHRAERIRQLCVRLAVAHGIGHEKTGRGWTPRPVGAVKTTTIVRRKVSHAR